MKKEIVWPDIRMRPVNLLSLSSLPGDSAIATTVIKVDNTEVASKINNLKNKIYQSRSKD